MTLTGGPIARRFTRCGIVAWTLIATAGLVTAQPTYDYGSGSGFVGDSGFMLLLEGIFTNPRNTDNVVATELSGVIQPIIPAWDDELAGRLGLGYQWSNGNRIMGTLWGFSTSNTASGVGTFAFPIGPPIASGEGDIGTGYEIKTEISATTADLAFGHIHEVSEKFNVEWSVGLRYATFEETAEGAYSNVTTLYAPRKSNEATMLGARAAVRGSYLWNRFGLTAAFAASFLDGELTASSGQTGVTNPGTSAASLQDDGRSGNIWELEVSGVFVVAQDKVNLLVGWEQQVWEGLPTDLMRNLPGSVILPGPPQTSVVLRDRDSVTFSGFKLGVQVLF